MEERTGRAGERLAAFAGWFLRGLSDLLPPPSSRRLPCARLSAEGFTPPPEPARGPVRIELAPSLVLTEERGWPDAAFLHLPRLMAARAEAIWPLHAEPLAAGWTRIRRAHNPGPVVRLCLARAETVAAAISAAEAAGFRIGAVGPAGEPAIDLRPRRPAPAWLRALPALLALLLLALPVVHLSALSAARDNAVEASRLARAAAAPALAGQAALAALAETVEDLRRAAEAAPSPGPALARLTAALPAGCRLDAVALAGSELRLTGAAPVAAQVLAALQAAFPERAARFAGPVLRDAGAGVERFEILIDGGAA